MSLSELFLQNVSTGTNLHYDIPLKGILKEPKTDDEILQALNEEEIRIVKNLIQALGLNIGNQTQFINKVLAQFEGFQ